MRIAAILPTCRPDLCATMARSWAEAPATRDIPLIVRAQTGESADYQRALSPVHVLDYKYRPFGGPIWPIRVHAMMDHPEIDIFISIDDDMEILFDLTDYAPALAKVREPGVGLVSCNWARSEGLLHRALSTKSGAWVKQPLVTTGGGLIVPRHVVQLMIPTCNTAWMFEGTQAALVAYLAGYENWRYRGSICLHRIMSPGGIKATRIVQPLQPLDPRYVRPRDATPVYTGAAAINNRHIPESEDLTPLARELHQRNRERLLA